MQERNDAEYQAYLENCLENMSEYSAPTTHDTNPGDLNQSQISTIVLDEPEIQVEMDEFIENSVFASALCKCEENDIEICASDNQDTPKCKICIED